MWEAILTSLLQSSILGPSLFNIFLNDLFLFVTHCHLSNKAVDNTLYCFSDNISDVSDKLRIDLA